MQVARWYSGYGELERFGGRAPDQGRLRSEGAAYIDKEYVWPTRRRPCFPWDGGRGSLAHGVRVLRRTHAPMGRRRGGAHDEPDPHLDAQPPAAADVPSPFSNRYPEMDFITRCTVSWRNTGQHRKLPIGAQGSKRLEKEKRYCTTTASKHDVVPGKSWGTLSDHQIEHWKEVRCDQFFCRPNSLEGVGSYVCVPL